MQILMIKSVVENIEKWRMTIVYTDRYISLFLSCGTSYVIQFVPEVNNS